MYMKQKPPQPKDSKETNKKLKVVIFRLEMIGILIMCIVILKIIIGWFK